LVSKRKEREKTDIRTGEFGERGLKEGENRLVKEKEESRRVLTNKTGEKKGFNMRG